MKLLYFILKEIKKNDGVDKKILSQVNVLKKNNIQVDICSEKINNNKIYRILYQKEYYFEKTKNNIISRQWLCCNFGKIKSYIIKKKINVVYIRYECLANPFFINFLKKLKRNKIKIILEIPTYPYDGELKNTKNILKKIKYTIEKKYRLKMKNYVDRIVTFSNDEEIFGIKTIRINNGIDLNQVSIIRKNNLSTKNELNFIGIARIAFWHGFDRFILSMIEYYKNVPKKIIKFHIVGDGDKKTINDLKKLVKKNNLEEYVIFYGYKSGKELEEIYNKIDIGIGSLGNFRKGILGGGGLKNQEYCAKGVPFIITGYDAKYSDVDFVYRISTNESLIDLNDIISWYQNLKITPQEIRKYAEDNLTWDKQMKKVVDYILKIEEK